MLIFFSCYEYKQVGSQGNYTVVIVLVACALYFFQTFTNIASVYYDKDHLLATKMFQTINIPFDRVLKIHRKMGTFISSPDFQYGYQLKYLTDNQVEKSFIFFVNSSERPQLRKFVEILAGKNQAADIDLKE